MTETVPASVEPRSHRADWIFDLNTRNDAYRCTLLGTIDRQFLSLPAAKVSLIIVVAAALIVPSIQFVTRINEVEQTPYREGGLSHRTALGRWLPTTELLPEGDPYGYGHWFPLPPAILLVLRPLHEIGYVPAGVVWVVLKNAGLVVAMIFLLRTIAPAMPVPTGVLAMAAVFGLRPFVADVQHGNVNAFVFIFLALGWAFYVQQRDKLAGFFIALAIVTKVTPALLLLYFLYKRQWRVSVATAVSVVVVGFVIPGLWLGFANNWRLNREWFDMLIAPYLFDGYVTINVLNQALYGVILRVGEINGIIPLEHISPADAAIAGSDVSARPIGFAFLRPLVSLSVLGSLAWFCRTRSVARSDPRLFLEFGLVLLAMLLLSERTWKHHATTLLLVYIGLWFAVACFPWTDRFRAVLAGGLFVQLALMMGTSEGLLGERLADRVMVAGAFCWAMVAAFVEIGVILTALRLRLGVRSPAAL